MERTYAFRIDLAGLEGRVIDDPSYPGSPDWHKEVRRLARELEWVLREIDRYCFKP